ncbi:hypothetical protein [Rhodococcus sp. NPDC003348]
MSDGNALEVTIPDPSADWIESRVRGLCVCLDAIDRRVQRTLRGEFTIGWVELDSADHGIVDYWAVGVNSEYPVEISWIGDIWTVIEPNGGTG